MVETNLVIARKALLEPAELNDAALQKVMYSMLGHAIDYADLYFQTSRHESWVLEDGIVKEGQHNIEQGVGVRAVSGEKTGFAYSDEIILPALTESADAARAIARQGQTGSLHAWQSKPIQPLYSHDDPLTALSAEQKIALLQSADAEARRQDPRVKQVIVSLAGVHEVVLVVANDGTLSADVRPLVRMNVSVIAEHNGRREQGSAGGGGRVSYEYFLQDDHALRFAREAVR